MKQSRFSWQLFSSWLLITLLSTILVTGFASSAIGRFQLDQTRRELTAVAQIVAIQFEPLLVLGDRQAIDKACKALRSRTVNRITVISVGGVVLGDSDHEVSTMGSHADRPEFINALTGDVGHSVRQSRTLQKPMMYLALPVISGDQVAAVVRVSKPMDLVNAELRAIQLKIAAGWLAIAVLATIALLYLSRRLIKPLENLAATVRHMIAEEEPALPVTRLRPLPAEVEQINRAISVLLERLDEKVRTITRQSGEVEAVLSSMTEAVLAIDSQGKLLNINQAAADLFLLDKDSCRGQLFQNLVRNQAFHHFLDRTLASQTPLVAELSLYRPEPVFLEAHGTRLQNPTGEAMGAVIVLNDVTRLKNLENVRRDFVANVTHELRTPITTIQGFVETLRDSDLSDVDDAQRFLAIISKHADRLDTLIEDLLTLSKLEHQHGSIDLELVERSLVSCLTMAVEACRAKAEERQISLSIHCDSGLTARLHPTLFEQAIINLVDNAIKYSAKGRPVRVSATAGKGENFIHIVVEDQGSGIAEKHLPRLFERFYRVDRGRSREMGGTGLGLSIVKHIVGAHGGKITVESKVDYGSRFTIFLPKPRIE